MNVAKSVPEQSKRPESIEHSIWRQRRCLLLSERLTLSSKKKDRGEIARILSRNPILSSLRRRPCLLRAPL
eukprot:1277521-Prorocentrum_lima.AAC.1